MNFLIEDMPQIRPIKFPNNGSTLRAVKNWIMFRRKWELVEDWNFSVNNTEYVIPKGFIFDGASIPRSWWGILSPTGILFIPSIIHDFMYKKQELIAVDGIKVPVTRRESDVMFRDVAGKTNNIAIINYLVYFVLRILGWYKWNKYK